MRKIVAAIALTLFIGCEPEGRRDSSTLVIALDQEIISMDSAFSYDFVSSPVVIQVTESLLYYDNKGDLRSGLCESWGEIEPLTYIYNVKRNVKFSDGKAMTMEDVLFSLERYRNKTLASPLAWMYDNVESITRSGEWQFTVKLKQPDALWKHVFATTAGHIHNRAFVEKHNGLGDYGEPAAGVLGTGPYIFKRWDENQIELEYNPEYWNREKEGVPDVKHIVYRFIPDDTKRALALISGQVDVVLTMPVEMLEEARENADLNIFKLPSYMQDYFGFNCKKPPFDDVHLRRAVSYALDIETLQNNILKEYSLPTQYIPVNENLFVFEKDSWMEYRESCERLSYNMEAAQEEIAKSEYADGFECTIVVDEKPLNMSIALFFADSAEKIGGKVKIEKTMNEQLVGIQLGSGIDENGVRPYDAGFFSWCADFPDPASVLVPLYTNAGDGGSNFSAYENAEVDRLLTEQAGLTDNSERASLMFAALDIINADSPAYVISYQNVLVGAKNTITRGIKELGGSWMWNMYVKNIRLSRSDEI
jgi:peptide/nickel transport system substrate-binding protein